MADKTVVAAGLGFDVKLKECDLDDQRGVLNHCYSVEVIAQIRHYFEETLELGIVGDDSSRRSSNA